MNKFLMIIFSLAMMFYLFGCNNQKTDEETYTVNRITEVSEELESKITSAYNKEYETDKEYQLVIDDCYLFNDGLCFFFAQGLYDTYLYYVSEKVSEYNFIYPNSNNLLVLENDNISSMTDAFENGTIDEARVKALFNSYKTQYAELYEEEIETFDYNLMIEIKNNYALRYNINDLNKIIISNYFGTYNESVILMIYHGGYYQVVTNDVIDGIKFTYPTSIEIKVYNNGAFCNLSKAYENKLITRDELIEISHKLNK